MVDVSKVQASMGVPLADQLVTLGIRVSVPQVFVGMLIAARSHGYSRHSRSRPSAVQLQLIVEDVK